MTRTDTVFAAKGRASWTLDVIVKLSMPFLIGVAGWTFTELQNHEKRLIILEATHYSKEDAEVENRVQRESLSEIRTVVSVVKEKMNYQDEKMEFIVEAVKEIKEALKPK